MGGLKITVYRRSSRKSSETSSPGFDLRLGLQIRIHLLHRAEYTINSADQIRWPILVGYRKRLMVQFSCCVENSNNNNKFKIFIPYKRSVPFVVRSYGSQEKIYWAQMGCITQGGDRRNRDGDKFFTVNKLLFISIYWKHLAVFNNLIWRNLHNFLFFSISPQWFCSITEGIETRFTLASYNIKIDSSIYFRPNWNFKTPHY